MRCTFVLLYEEAAEIGGTLSMFNDDPSILNRFLYSIFLNLKISWIFGDLFIAAKDTGVVIIVYSSRSGYNDRKKVEFL